MRDGGRLGVHGKLWLSKQLECDSRGVLEALEEGAVHSPNLKKDNSTSNSWIVALGPFGPI